RRTRRTATIIHGIVFAHLGARKASHRRTRRSHVRENRRRDYLAAVSAGIGHALLLQKTPQLLSQFLRLLFRNEVTAVGDRTTFGVERRTLERLDNQIATPARTAAAKP